MEAVQFALHEYAFPGAELPSRLHLSTDFGLT